MYKFFVIMLVLMILDVLCANRFSYMSSVSRVLQASDVLPPPPRSPPATGSTVTKSQQSGAPGAAVLTIWRPKCGACGRLGGGGLGTVRSNVVKDIFDVILLFINECECVFLEPKAWKNSCQGFMPSLCCT